MRHRVIRPGLVIMVLVVLCLAAVSRASAPDWQPPVGFLNTMTVHAVVRLPDSSYVSAVGSLLAVFKDGAIRGVDTIFNGPAVQMQFQVDVASNATSESGLTLQVYDAASSTIYDISGTLTFTADSTVGLIRTPQEFVAMLPVTHPPVATAATVRVPVNVPSPLVLAGTDADGDPLTFRLESNPAHGTLSGFNPASGTVTYTSTGTYTGADSFTFAVSDNGVAWSAPATVGITIQNQVLGTINVIGGNVATIDWGAQSGATPGADNGIDYLAPVAGFDGRYVAFIAPITAGTALNRDVRGALSGERWQIHVVAGDGAVTLAWDTNALPPGNWCLWQLTGLNGTPVAGTAVRMAAVGTLPAIAARQRRYFAIGELVAKPRGDMVTSGVGTAACIGAGERLDYTIHFENLTSATAPAQLVTITVPLDANLDWSTFALGTIGFNTVTLTVPAATQAWSGNTTVTTDSNPVTVTAALNPATGLAQWTMQSVNPVSGKLPADPLAGFLPPNDSSLHGAGYVTFSVKPKAALPNATVFHHQASIVFDANAPLATNQTANTLDSAPPVLAPRIYRSGAGNSIAISLAGNHSTDLSGVASFDVYVATGINGVAAFWRTVAGVETVFAGTWGEVYAFFIQAKDAVGNQSAYPLSPDAVLRLPQWAFAIALTNADVPAVFAALDSAATTGWDPNLDEAAPPAMRDTPGRVVFAGTDPAHQELACDCQVPADTVVWLLNLQPGTQPLGLGWNRATVPVDKYLWLARLDAQQEPMADSFVDLGVTTAASVTQAGAYVLTLSTEMRARLDLKAGWNLLALPLTPLEPAPDTVFGMTADNRSTCWRWSPEHGTTGGYAATATVSALTGYWVYSKSARSVLVAGAGVRDNAITLIPGWNLVGPYADSVLPQTDFIVGPAWGWEAAGHRFSAVPPGGVLQRGKGYWVWSNAVAELQLLLAP